MDQQRVFRSTGSKVLAVLVSGLFWFWVVSEREVRIEYEIPLEYRNLSPDRVLLGGAPTRVTLHLQGASDTMRRIQSRHLAAVVDLSSIPLGKKVVTLSEENLVLPPGISVVRISPESIEVESDRRVAKSVPVRLQTVDAPPPGYRLTDYRLDPQQITVVGPDQEIRRITEVETETVSLRDRTRTWKDQVRLLPPSVEVRVLSAQEVSVFFKIEEQEVERTLEGVPIRITGTDRPGALDPPTVDVTLSGLHSQVQALEADDLAVTVSGARLAPGAPGVRRRLRAEFRTPDLSDKITLVRLSRRTTTVRLAAD